MSEKKKRGRRQEEPEMQQNFVQRIDDREEPANHSKHISIIEDEIANNLFHQRGQARETALTKIIECFRRSVLVDFALDQRDTFYRALNNGLSASPPEQVLSCILLRVLCVTVGGEWSDLFEHYRPILSRMAAQGSNASVRAESVFALGVLCFVWGIEVSQTEYCMDVFSNLIAKSGVEDVGSDQEDDSKETPRVEVEIIHSAIDMWCFISTTVDLPQVVDELIPKDYSNIVSHLYSDNLDLRLAAGEAVAYLSSLVAENEEENGETYSCYYFNSYIDVRDVRDYLSTDGMNLPDHSLSPRGGFLSHSNPNLKKGSKKERLMHKQGFAKYLPSFEDGKKGPLHPVSITVKNHQFQFQTWSEIKRLEVFREILQEGFQSHLQENHLLADIFGIEISMPVGKLTKQEKRQFLSSNSVFAKGRTQKRKAGRDAKVHLQENLEANF